MEIVVNEDLAGNGSPSTGSSGLGMHDISRGLIEGEEIKYVIGYETTMSSPSGGTIGIYGSGSRPGTGVLPAASTIWVVTTHANDTAAGTGCQEVTVYGYDASWNYVSEAVATVGVGSAATTQEFLAVEKIAGTAYGSGGFASGQINSRDTTNNISTGSIIFGYYTSLNGYVPIPDGKTAYLLQFTTTTTASAASGETVTFAIQGYEVNSVPTSTTGDILLKSTEAFNKQYPGGLKICEGPGSVYIQRVTNSGTPDASANMMLLISDSI